MSILQYNQYSMFNSVKGDHLGNAMQAMRAGLQGTMRVKGLLEMMFEVLSDWIDAFIEDVEEVEASETGNTTPKGSLSPRDGRGMFSTVLH